ncbi:alpha/beta fold hydrolase [Tianweitania sediminis]|uniref:Alpha/beta fold hydrolase n=1 Tax=Tianweitania sediminis TaxID=1502156 RepID=A0A8J7QYZ0_9HYPH|nr:alpha/beta hydrolase [Tianweitania sediminis]MBP0437353.1 alpha/beta fold hydrolase [Tianweitania sediminis]
MTPDTISDRAKVNGIELQFEIGGEGPPLLLISGLGQNMLAWAGVIGEFRKHHRTVVFDNRGTGRSSVPPGPYTMDAMADDVAGLIAHLGLVAPAVVGWSLGGSVLQSLLIRYEHSVGCAVLLNTLPAYTTVQKRWLDAQLALRRSGAPAEALMTMTLPWALSPLILSDHDRTAALVDAMVRNPWPTSYAGYEAQGEGIRVYDSRAGLPKVSVPTLVLVGAEDILTPVAQSAEIASLIPASDLVVLGRGGHSMVLDYPHEVLRTILPWIARHTVMPPERP